MFRSLAKELPIDQIIVNRDERQRRDLTGIAELANSLKLRGLINPVVIDKDRNLIAGERRLTAAKSLGWLTIAVREFASLDPIEQHLIELEENIKREALPWQDECRAIQRFHELQQQRDPTWNKSRTAEALGFSVAEGNIRLMVAEALETKDPLVAEAPRLSTAKGIVRRRAERVAANSENELLRVVLPEEFAPPPITDQSTGLILNLDFNDWAQTYSGPKFNLIHCDFPYGIGANKFNQGAAASYSGYEDSEDVYWTLVDTLLAQLDRFCEPSAHLVFWFSMDYYQETYNRLSTRFSVDRFPLVWHKSDGAGIIPDPNRGPRRTYETAFFASRGDRKIVRPVANSFGTGITRGRHMSEKSQDLLRHFFRMLCDDTTSLLDPTCGSGSALRAAHAVGVKRFLGLEVNTEFATEADRVLAETMSRTLSTE